MQKATSSNHGQFFHTFDGLRIIAVILVLLQHETFLAKRYLDIHFAGGIFSHGEFRIDLFFLLSGFFAAWMAARDQEAQKPGIHFLGRRLRRLLPLLWLLTSLKLALMLGLDFVGRSETLDGFQILRSYTLLPAPGYPIILSAWTLSFELVFCTVWSVLLSFPPRIRQATLGLWVVAILAYGVICITPSRWLPGFVLHPYFLDFIAGALLSEMAPRIAMRLRGSVILLVGGALLVLAMAVEPELKVYPELVRRLVWGGAVFMVIVGLFRWESQKVSFVMPSGLRLLSRSSYGIYLTHSLVLYVVFDVLKGRLTDSMLTQLLLAAVAAATLSVGILVHHWVEVPLQRALIVLQSKRKVALIPLKRKTTSIGHLSGD